MSPVSNRLSIQYLENYITDKRSDSNVGASAAAPESFQSDTNQREVYSRHKKHLQQKESSNDASNETSDCDNGGAHVQKPLTSRNLEAQNKGNGDSSENAVNNGDSSPRTSGPDGENSNGNSNGNSRITSEATSTSAEANVKLVLPKVFFCKICNQGFTRKHNMVSHEMIHTTIKLHSCKNCNLSFRRIHDLKRHEKLHTGEKPFHCVNCDRSFVRPDALTRHLNSPHACSGSKHNNESPQCTQTSNSSSSSYQASKRQQTIDASANGQKKLNHSNGAVKMLPSLANKFNDEQSLPLGSEFSSTSLLPTGEKAIFSDGDSGIQSSRVNRATIPGSLAGSNSGFYARLSPLTGDTSGTAHNRPTFEINRWRSQQMHKGEEVSESMMKDIVQKHPFSSNSTSVNSGGDELKALNDPKISNHPPNAPVYQQQHSASSNQQSYPHSFSPFHRSSASMAAINKTVIQASSLKRPSFVETQSASSAEKPPSLSEVKNLQNNGIPSQSGKEVIMPSQSSPSYRTGHDSFITGCQSNQPQCYASKSIIPSAPPFYNHATQSRSYIPMVSNQDDWQGPQMLPFNSQAARPSSVGHWQDMNSFRFENHEQKEVFSMSSELVRAEAYHDLQTHTNTLQMRVSSLEQRMEMLEEKMKRDFKDNIKLQKRHERHERQEREERKAKKKSKKK